MSPTFRIHEIHFEWVSQENEAVIAYEINGHRRTQRIFRGDLQRIWLDIGEKYGINTSNIEQFLNSSDARHDVMSEDYVKKYIEYFHKV